MLKDPLVVGVLALLLVVPVSGCADNDVESGLGRAGPIEDSFTAGRLYVLGLNASWVHIQYPVTPDLKDNDLALAVDWENAADGVRVNLVYDSYVIEGPAFSSEVPTSVFIGVEDAISGRAGVSATVAGNAIRHEGGLPSPVNDLTFRRSNSTYSVSVQGAGRLYEELSGAFGMASPVRHLVFLTNDLTHASFNVRAEWRNTSISISTGGSDDGFFISTSSFVALAHAGATAPVGSPSMSAQGKHVMNMAYPGGRTLFFLYAPAGFSDESSEFPGMGGRYVRPDGTRSKDLAPRQWGLEFVSPNLQGDWTFEIDAAAHVLEGNVPILFGAVITL